MFCSLFDTSKVLIPWTTWLVLKGKFWVFGILGPQKVTYLKIWIYKHIFSLLFARNYLINSREMKKLWSFFAGTLWGRKVNLFLCFDKTRVCITISVKVASDRFISLVRYKLRLRYAYQIWKTGGPTREKSRIHSFTGAVDAITMLPQYFLTKTHIPSSIWRRVEGLSIFFSW